ncbi:hypothetical protein FA95DRAFT_1611652, partial [Auriscalpium vulgare]
MAPGITKKTSKPKYGGLSSRSRLYGSRDGRGRLQREDMRPGKQAERREKSAKKRANVIAGMDQSDRDAVAAMDEDLPSGIGDHLLDSLEYEAATISVPPGEEGAQVSHEGGEYEMFQHFVVDLANSIYCRSDDRIRRDRIERRNAQWAMQLPSLVDAYLQHLCPQTSMAATPGEGEAEIDGPSFVLETVDVFEHTQRTFVQTPTDVYPNVAMMRAG